MIQRKIRRKQSYNEANEKECKKIDRILAHCKKVYAIVEHYPHVIIFAYTGFNDKDGMPIIWDWFAETDIWEMKRLDEVFSKDILIDWFFNKAIAQTFLELWQEQRIKKIK